MAKIHERDRDSYTDFEVHAEAYFRLREFFPIVRANYQIDDRESFRFGIVDILIKSKTGKNILVVEIKKNHQVKRRGRQIERYKELANCPCIYICGMEEAKNAVRICLQVINKFYGKN